jgi:ubiquinone/menaquinone biosynthesis C-methylase UbiE
MSCVDVGCGAGFTTQIISQMIGKKGHIIGIDVDERYLQYCRNAKQQTNAKFMLDDIWNSRLVEKGDNFDLIYSRFMFLHLKDVRKAVQSMKRLAKKGVAW